MGEGPVSGLGPLDMQEGSQGGQGLITCPLPTLHSLIKRTHQSLVSMESQGYSENRQNSFDPHQRSPSHPGEAHYNRSCSFHQLVQSLPTSHTYPPSLAIPAGSAPSEDSLYDTSWPSPQPAALS